ncbi:MAG: ABC transporter substrate-binding protein [Acetobacteraceae bacterium]
MTTRRRLIAATGLAATPLSGALAQAISGQFQQSGLVGTLQGPSQATQIPPAFKEAPALAELVRQGKLPPVAQRLPAEPMVIKPLQTIGRYGGTWRRGFIGPSDGENGNRINASDKLLFWNPAGDEIVPSVARGYEMSADGKTTTLFLRKGMKWSSGDPFTADDFVFWFEDIYGNKDIVPTPIPDMSPAGKPGRLVKIDETTVQFQFDVPYYLLLDVLAGDTLLGGGQSVRQATSFSYGGYSPMHYLKQFLPKYSSEADANRRAKEQGFETWVRMLHVKKDWQLNPELPTIGAWTTTRPINTPTWAMQRNPYYWAVDTEGNQLPYIDQIVMTLAEDLEVVNLRAMAGEYDEQERHINLLKLPVILENRERSQYDVHLDLAFNGSDTVLLFNHSYKTDPEVAKWLKNADFRRALSMAIDREQMNETFWLGLGTPGSVAPNESLPESPGPEWRTKWSTLDLDAANKKLDAIGLTKKDRDGFRLRTDNGQRLVIQIQAVNSLLPWPQHAEMISQHWRRVGVYAEVKELERNLALQRSMANESQIHVWQNGGSELIYLFPRHTIPVDPTEPYLGVEYAKYYASGGTQGTKPEDPGILRIFELFRSAAGQQRDERNRTAQEIWKIVVDQQLGIGICGQSPAAQGVRIVSRKLGNIPERACIAQHCRTPGSSHPETWFFKA